MIGKITLSTWVVKASTKATNEIDKTTKKFKFSTKQTKTIWERIDARVPSKVLEDSGNRIRPNFDPTMLAAESPIPMERTPLKRISWLVLFKSEIN